MGWIFECLERRCAFSLDFRPIGLSVLDEQEVKLLYAVRATYGHQFGGVPTTPRGRDLFLTCVNFS